MYNIEERKRENERKLHANKTLAQTRIKTVRNISIETEEEIRKFYSNLL